LGGIPPKPPFLPHAFANPQNRQIDKLSILKAADGGTKLLFIADPGHIVTVVIQATGPGVIVVDLGSPPEDSGVTKIVKTTIINTITTWESGKTT
jgi:ABC-type sugar transport system substrate-binding protein